MSTVILGSGIAGISAGYHLEKKGEKVLAIIGPEGGFSFKENEHFSSFCQNISLSKTILRAEVASVVAVSTLKAVSV